MAKNTNTFLNDIKNYDLIRNVIRHMFMYGNYSKGDIVNQKLVKSERSFYDTIKRIENYLGKEYLDIHKLPNRKKDKNGYRIKYDIFQCPTNYLTSVYQNCSYVIEDFIFYFTYLQAFKLNSTDIPYTLISTSNEDLDHSDLTIHSDFSYDELIGTIRDLLNTNEEIIRFTKNINSPLIDDAENIITSAKAYDRFQELKELGLIVQSGYFNGKPYYKLGTDIFAACSLEELEQLHLMTQFFYNYLFIAIPGYYLATTLDQYISSNFFNKTKSQFHNLQNNNIFFYKNPTIQTVIDDNILWDILMAIHQMTPISYNYKGKSGHISQVTAYPIKVIVDKQYGRHYFYGYNYQYANFFTQRIDYISDIKLLTDFKDDRFPFLETPQDNIRMQLTEIYEKNMANVWNIATSPHASTSVTIHFYFEPKDYQRGLYHVLSTKRHGHVIEKGNGHFTFTITVQDEMEMVPWIRSFGKNAKVDPHTNFELHQKMRTDYKETLKQYEIIQ